MNSSSETIYHIFMKNGKMFYASAYSAYSNNIEDITRRGFTYLFTTMKATIPIFLKKAELPSKYNLEKEFLDLFPSKKPKKVAS